MNPYFSVIVLIYNNRDFLEQCLSSLILSEEKGFEVIVVDNGSGDGSAKFARERFGQDPRLKVVLLEKNLGYAVGNNLGAAEAKGEILFFLNPDTKLDPHCLAEVREVFAAEPKVGAVQALLCRADFPEKIDCSGGFIDRFGWSFKRDYDQPRRDFPEVENIFYAMGAALGVRRELFRSLGGFEETMFLYHEDVDFGWRVWLRGYRVVLAEKAVVYHYGGGTAKESADGERVFHRERNHLLTLAKNYSPLRLIFNLPLVFFFYFAAGFYFIFGERKKEWGWAYFRALVWFFTHLGEIFQRRKASRKLKAVQDHVPEGLFLKNIVAWDIFRTIAKNK